MTLSELNEYFDLLQQHRKTAEILKNIKGSNITDKRAEITDTEIKIRILVDEIDKRNDRVYRFIDSIGDYYIHMIFRLRFLRGLSWKEIAGIVGGGNTEDGVKSVCYRYLKKLQLGDAS